MGMRRIAYCTCLCWILGLGTAIADSGRKDWQHPTFTVEAFEINITFNASLCNASISISAREVSAPVTRQTHRPCAFA